MKTAKTHKMRNLVLLLMAALSLWFLFKPKKEAIVSSSSDMVDEKTGTPVVPQSDEPPHALEAQILPSNELPPELKRKADFINKSFVYEEELKKLETLKTQLPESKPELVKLVTSSNPYEKENIPLRLHSTEELTSRRMESLKIMALKILMDHEKSKVAIMGDLNTVIKSASDIKIKQFALSERESVQNKRFDSKPAKSTKK